MRTVKLILSTVVALLVGAPAAGACGSLVAPNGSVHLLRTSTLAAWSHGVEHYVTNFEFGGTPKSFGSIVPLPAQPTKVERGGDWTLQRLQREVAPLILEETAPRSAAAGDEAKVLQQVRIESLDVTILRGGGRAVARWAREHDYSLSADTPDVLEFYSRRSPYFMAARFDASAAADQGLKGGDGIPVHLTIPVDEPWVPLHILGTGKPSDEVVAADVFLLTPRKPSLLHGDGVSVERSEQASLSLLSDLRSDRGMGWLPDRMWLTYTRVAEPVGRLDYDLAIDVRGHAPDPLDAGLSPSGLFDRVAFSARLGSG